MKKTLLGALAAVALGTTFALSQPTFAGTTTPPTPPSGAQAGHHGGKMGKIIKELNLTDDQKAQIKTILQNARPQVQGVRQDTTLTPDQKKAKLKEINKSTRQQILALLTPEQKAKLQELHGKGHKRGGNV